MIKNIIYTYKHNRCIVDMYKKIISNKVPLSIYLHDIDKIFLYLLLSKKITHIIHRKFSNHHYNNRQKSYNDYIEMILDWESARYTKPDKPLTAKETCLKYYPQLQDILLPIIEYLNLDNYSSIINKK